MAKCLDDIRGELDVLVDVIPKTVPTEKIILFGSFVNGTPHENSDIDVYVVLRNDIGELPYDAIHSIRCAIDAQIDTPMDLLAGFQSTFDKRKVLPTLEHTIDNEGIVLYGS